MPGRLLRHERKELLTPAASSMDLGVARSYVQETRHKGHVAYESIGVKCPEQANPERQQADTWLPGARGGGRE